MEATYWILGLRFWSPGSLDLVTAGRVPSARADSVPCAWPLADRMQQRVHAQRGEPLINLQVAPGSDPRGVGRGNALGPDSISLNQHLWPDPPGKRKAEQQLGTVGSGNHGEGIVHP
jgi:hypothetical protein